MTRRSRTAVVIGVALLTALGVAIEAASAAAQQPSEPADRSLAAQLLAAAVLLLVSLALFTLGRKRPVALRDVVWNGTAIGVGRPIPASEADVEASALVRGTDYQIQRGSFFRGLYLGQDGRWSTSKLQPLMWTYAIVYGLLSLVFAKWLGNAVGWNKQVEMGLQQEYLVLLGGPFAAAVLAKFITTTKDENGTIQKTDAGEGAGGPADVITDDAGETDLVDFQYLLFNLLALGVFLGTLWFNLQDAFPNLPDLLVGLTSVSGATYVAKKAAERQRPQLKAVVPAKARINEQVEVWGENLLVGSLMQPPPADWVPKATIGGREGTVALAPRRRTGADRLLVTVPATAPAETTELVVYTPNGTTAGTLPFEVLP